jgi:hypothetical protein
VATTAANELAGPIRRSTRIERAIPVTITGVDAWRGPYIESVSTVNVSAHGCNYQSAHQVLNDSLVIIELKSEQEKTTRSARGRVKYVKRPAETGELFQTAIELEDPGNVWGINDPPGDWLPWAGPKSVELDTSKAKPFAVPRPEQETPRADDKSGKPARTAEAQGIAPPSGVTPVAQVVGGFQQHLEKMLSEAAAIAVHDKAKATFEELRGSLREEVKRLIAETIKTNADATIDKSLKQLKVAAQESTQALHVQWSKQVESELQLACDRIQTRGREMDEVSQALSLSALEKLQNSVEASRRDSVDRIIARLKEQSAPLLNQVQKALVELNQGTQEVNTILSRSLEESTVRIKEIHTQLEKQFEKAIRDRLEAAEAEFERAARSATIGALHDLRGLSEKHEAEAKTRLQNAFEPIMQESLATLHEKATGASQQFADELEDYSRSHLEFVGGSISELAKGLRKKTKE